MRSYEFYIKPAGGECAITSVKLPQSGHAVLSGRVLDQNDAPVEEALVLLLDQDTEEQLSYTVTDENGRFWFGPLPGDRLYFLRVQKTDGQTRTVELSK